MTAAWKGKQWPEPAPAFVLMGIGDDVAVNAKVKGTFEQERSSRARAYFCALLAIFWIFHWSHFGLSTNP